MTNTIKAITIGLDFQKPSLWSSDESLSELTQLAKTANIETMFQVTQRREHPDVKYYVGKGKLDEIKDLVQQHQIQVIITDDELSPAQHKTVEKYLNVKVMDRTGLILDIFAQKAQTYEAKLQIELAQLDYLYPRLTNLWTHLSRLGGGIGTRGPGEKQLEVDKRQIRAKMKHLKSKLKLVEKQRFQRRQKRHQTPILTGALVGYTNTGKSTLMNVLTQSAVLSEDKLFATLDPTTRKVSVPSNEKMVITDTVGFIQKLPHHLVNAFYSTLEEVTDADFLLHVIDASHPNIDGIIDTANELIKALNSDQKPIIYVFNKMDKVSKPNLIKRLAAHYTPHVFISALNQDNITDVYSSIQTILDSYQSIETFDVPHHCMDLVHYIHELGQVISTEHNDKSSVITAKINTLQGEKIRATLFKRQAE